MSVTDPPEVAPVRTGEEFDEARVEKYLREHLPDEDLSGPMQVAQFPGGHANLTYLVRFGEREFVLRRPPLGPVAPKAHDMAREYRVLSRLADHFPQAPRAYLLCENPEVMGATFILMERRHGLVMRGTIPPELDAHTDGRRRASNALIDTIADFHLVDYAAIGLEGLGKPEGFAERQVRGWNERWHGAKHEDNALFDEMYAWLVDNLPRTQASSLVHNDLKFDNVMIDPANPDRITAFLDWDMTTLGDPLVDLGTFLAYWVEAGDPEARGATLAVTAQEGFPTRSELAERYAARTGSDLSVIPWYEAFAHWKTAVVLQQIYIRFRRGQTTDERFALMETRVPMLVELSATTAGVR
ncbi:MAG: phosphotransferase family protein [Deltaproteobacteria bacterium]|nr:phosphotransferase family protein [Deltaproteobacteria bacterium]